MKCSWSVNSVSFLSLAKLCMTIVSVYNHPFRYIPFIAQAIILLFILLITILNVNIILSFIYKKPNKICSVYNIVNLFAYVYQGLIWTWS